MRRLIGLVILVLAIGALPDPRAVAQPALTQVYEDRVCGLRLSYPPGWAAQKRSDLGAQVVLPENPPTVVIVGPVRDIRLAEGSVEALALAAAGAYCLDCLRQNLVWIDRFTQGSITGTYTISRGSLRVGDREIPGGFWIAFFLVENGTARDLGPSGRTRAEAQAWVLESRYRQLEPTIQAVVRSIQFMRPEPASGCWP